MALIKPISDEEVHQLAEKHDRLEHMLVAAPQSIAVCRILCSTMKFNCCVMNTNLNMLELWKRGKRREYYLLNCTEPCASNAHCLLC